MKRCVFVLIALLVMILTVSCNEPSEDSLQSRAQSDTESTATSEPNGSEAAGTESSDSETGDGSNAVWTPFF